jgi:hypothetical protein
MLTGNQCPTNSPESDSVTLDDHAVFEAARNAVTLLKKTFETWIVIGKAIVRARDIADRRGGGKTFMRLIEQQGLAPLVNKTTASNLLRIMEQLPEVTKWHETLTDKQQIDWAAPTTILKRCPVFIHPEVESDNSEEKPLTKAKQTELELAKALQEVDQLTQQVKHSDGSLFDLKRDKAEDIGRVIADNISETRWKAIKKATDDYFKEKQQPAG